MDRSRAGRRARPASRSRRAGSSGGRATDRRDSSPTRATSGPPHGAGWAWNDLQWHFGAEVSALSFGDNLAAIQVTPGATGAPCEVRAEPGFRCYPRIENDTKTIAGSPKIEIHRDLDTNRVDVGGTLGRATPDGAEPSPSASRLLYPRRPLTRARRRGRRDRGTDRLLSRRHAPDGRSRPRPSGGDRVDRLAPARGVDRSRQQAQSEPPRRDRPFACSATSAGRRICRATKPESRSFARSSIDSVSANPSLSLHDGCGSRVSTA